MTFKQFRNFGDEIDASVLAVSVSVVDVFTVITGIAAVIALLTIYSAFRDRREQISSQFIEIANDRLKLHRAMNEREAEFRWGKYFKDDPVDLSPKAERRNQSWSSQEYRKRSVLGKQRWIIDPTKRSFVLVDPSAGPEVDFPIAWWDESDDPGSADREMQFEHNPGPFKPLVNTRFRTWSGYLSRKNTSMYNGPIAAVHEIQPDLGFAEVGFVKIRPSSYFAYANTCLVLEVVDSYRWAKLGSITRSVNPLRLVWLRHPRLSWTLWRTKPLDFTRRSASVGLSVALLVCEGENNESEKCPKYRLLLHGRSASVATAPGRVHVVPAGELSLGSPKDRERADREQISIQRYVYSSFVKELAEELFCPAVGRTIGLTRSPTDDDQDPLKCRDPKESQDSKESEAPRELSRSDLDDYVDYADCLGLKLQLVGFMLDSLNLKGELLALAVVSRELLVEFGKKFGLELAYPVEEGKVLRSAYDGKPGIEVTAHGGIPPGVFEFPLTPATTVLLDRVDRWLLNG